MAVSKKKVSKRNPKTKAKTKRKPNPSFIEKILGRTKARDYDSIVVTVNSGKIELKGEDLAEFYKELHKLLTVPIGKIEIIFTPKGSKKTYILNRFGEDKSRSRRVLENEDDISRRMRERARDRQSRSIFG